MSDENDTIVTDKNHTYVDISAFGLDNKSDPYSTNEW